MKVLIVNKFLQPNGGSETYIFKIGEQLVNLGHEVQYFGMEHKDRIVGNQVECYVSNIDFHSGKLERLSYPFKIIYSREARKKIRKVLDSFEPDIIHLNNFNFQITPSVLYEIRQYKEKIRKKVKVMYTAHDSQLVCPNHLMQQYISKEKCTRCVGGSPWNCVRYKCIHGSVLKSLLGSFEAWIYRKFKTYQMIDIVICPSYFIKKKLDMHPDLKGKTITMHNFVEMTDEKNIVQCKEPYVLYFGRYSKEKGIETLLKVCKKLPYIPFVFAGNGPLEEQISKMENIDDKGFLKECDLRSLIDSAEFSIFPSECNENCPFSVMESLSSGTPVIGARIGGVPELIEDGKNGLLFTSGNEKELEEKIEYLWDEKAVREKLRQGCLNNDFDSAISYCQKLLKYYEM